MNAPNWFLAWPVKVSLGDRLADVPDEVRAFAPADLHITLAFLGAVDRDIARDTFDSLDLSLLSPTQISFGDVVLMGHPRRGTALSAEVADGRETLATQIGAQRSELLERAGARPERYEPRPHMTIARIHRRASRTAREAALRWAAAIDLSSMSATVERLALYTSSVDRQRTRFRIDREHDLAP